MRFWIKENSYIVSAQSQVTFVMQMPTQVLGRLMDVVWSKLHLDATAVWSDALLAQTCVTFEHHPILRRT